MNTNMLQHLVLLIWPKTNTHVLNFKENEGSKKYRTPQDVQLHSTDVSGTNFQITYNICQNMNENGTTKTFNYLTGLHKYQFFWQNFFDAKGNNKARK